MTNLILAGVIGEAALLAIVYAVGVRRGAAQHRADMQESAAEWKRCWLGDPPKATTPESKK